MYKRMSTFGSNAYTQIQAKTSRKVNVISIRDAGDDEDVLTVI